MKRIILLLICLFLVAVPMANAQSVSANTSNQEKAAYFLTLIKKYAPLAEISTVDPTACKQVGDVCISYKDIYDAIVAQYVYYANQP